MTTRRRVTVSLPPHLILAADRRAQELDRSRSWVVAEALRAHLQYDAGASPSVSAGAVAEAPPAAYAAPQVAESRRRRLRTDAALPPEERLWRAEQLGRLARRAQARGPRRAVIIFESYEDFYEWRKSRLIGA
jgi:hypothetical protein